MTLFLYVLSLPTTLIVTSVDRTFATSGLSLCADAVGGPAVLVGDIALASEPQLAVELLVINHVHQIGKHLTAISTYENVRTTCKNENNKNI